MTCCSVAQSCPTLCNHVDCSTSNFPVPHHLLEFAQVHVHCIGDALQPSHPLMLSFPSALNISQHQGLFQWVVCSHQMTKILEALASALVLAVNIQGWSPLRLTGLISLLSKGLSGVFKQHSLRASIFWHSAFFKGPALITVCDHWGNHSLDYTDLCLQSNVSAFQHAV